MPLRRSLIAGWMAVLQTWRSYGAEKGSRQEVPPQHHFHRGLRPQVGGYRDKEGRIEIKSKSKIESKSGSKKWRGPDWGLRSRSRIRLGGEMMGAGPVDTPN